MSSRIVLNLRTLRRSADDAFYAPQTDAPFEMGNITQGKPRMTRSGTVPTLLSGAGRRDTFSMAPPTSRVWTTSKTDGWDRSIPEMPPVSISVQVDVHRAIEVDEHQYDSDEKMIV
ncbi:hypothetical protein FRB90_009835 [Tulasnella sp. 427]|nr:hypothetical protein FRB90_009835 [Tulasnella sp. 427]